MRFIAEKWFIGPIAAAIGVYVVWLGCEIRAQNRAHEFIRTAVANVYERAKAGQYNEIAKQGFATRDAVAYLKQQDRLFGPISTYVIEDWGNWDLDNSTTTVSVSRERAVEPMTENADSSNRGPLEINGEGVGDTHDANGHRVIAGEADAMALAKHVIHLSAQGKVSSVHLRHVGNQWLATFHQSSDPHGIDQSLVFSEDGRLEQTRIVHGPYLER